MKRSNFNISLLVMVFMFATPLLMAQVSPTPKSAKELVVEAKKSNRKSHTTTGAG